MGTIILNSISNFLSYLSLQLPTAALKLPMPLVNS